MTCKLEFVTRSQEKLTIEDLRQLAASSVSLRNLLKGSKLNVNWPYEHRKSSGKVRIIPRMTDYEKQHRNTDMRLARSKALSEMSTIFTLIITAPAVAFTLYMLLGWAKVPETPKRIISLIGGLVSLLVEILLTVLKGWRLERHIKSKF